jgi:hypothetical protein
MLVGVAPPFEPSVKATVSWLSPAEMFVMVGASASTAVMGNVAADDVAATRMPDWVIDEVTEQVPAVTKATCPFVELTVQTAGVDEA